jgi:hypothetical protein
MITMCATAFVYFFAVIGLFVTIIAFNGDSQYKNVCEYKNGYTPARHRACLIKNGCGSDGSLCIDDNFHYCPEPSLECKIVKTHD